VYPSTTWVKLKRQITVAGHVLVKEYKDDGHTGTLLDRPALNQLRADLETDLFDIIHFLAADRIARAVAYQTIIVDERPRYDLPISRGAECSDVLRTSFVGQ
jgi:DNA invertase Pin-like site-specific DNA recombinase